MANNKYIGHNGQLIGPVSDRFLNPSKEINYSFYGEKKEFYNHLSSLPSIPCEGWTPEDGKVYLDGVDFAKQHQYYNGDDWRNCGLEFFISFNLHKNSSFGRIVAVPLTPADPSLGLGSYYDPLFDLMSQEHGLSLLQGQMDDIIDVVNRMQQAAPDEQAEGGSLNDVLKAFQWTFDNMGTDHTADHFNVPANGISLLERIIAKQSQPPVREGAPEDGGKTMLSQIFENNFDCYADTKDGSVVLAMTNAKFVEVVGKLISPTYPAEFVEWAAIRGWKCYTIDGKNVWVNSLINENHKTTPELYIFYQQSKSNTDAK